MISDHQIVSHFKKDEYHFIINDTKPYTIVSKTKKERVRK